MNRAAFDAGIVLVELSPLRTTLEDRYLVDGRGRCTMTRIIQAELFRLVRRRTVRGRGDRRRCDRSRSSRPSRCSRPPRRRGSGRDRAATTLASLTGTGGGTEAFAVGASFVGFLVFVTFIALIAGEFSGGTFRALLLRDPHRLRVIVGKLVGDAHRGGRHRRAGRGAHVRALARRRADEGHRDDRVVPASSLGAALTDYVTVFAGVAGWAIFGTTLAVIFRSVPLALGVGFAWAGPFENIVVDSWQTGYRFFPGQVLGSLIRGGTIELGIGRAGLTAALYTAIAAGVTLVLVSRRDVTS